MLLDETKQQEQLAEHTHKFISKLKKNHFVPTTLEIVKSKNVLKIIYTYVHFFC